MDEKIVVLQIRNCRRPTLLHISSAEAPRSLTRWWHFSAWNDVVAAIWLSIR